MAFSLLFVQKPDAGQVAIDPPDTILSLF